MKKLVIASTLALLFASGAYAAPVTSLTGTVVPMSPDNAFAAGPITQTPGIVWSADSTSSVFGWTYGYGFGGNGSWSGNPPMAGTNTGTSYMEYSFATMLAGVGGVLNYSPGSGSAAMISIFDASHNLLESSVLNFSTSSVGEFHGFQQTSANIGFFRLSGSYIGLRDLTVSSVTAVPEPESFAMLLAGMGLLGVVARRSKAQSV